MDSSLRATDFLHQSLYGNYIYAGILLKVSCFITIITAILRLYTTVVFSLSCVAPSIAVQLITSWLNMQLRTVLTKKQRTYSEFLSELDNIPRNFYNFNQPCAQTLSVFVCRIITITFYLNILTTFSLFVSIAFLIYNLAQYTAHALIIPVSFLPLFYAIFYNLRDWHSNREKHINWFYK